MPVDAKISQLIEQDGRTTAMVRFYKLIDQEAPERQLLVDMQLAFDRLLSPQELAEEIHKVMLRTPR